MSNESGRRTAREEVLTKAIDAVMGTRNKTYGPPTQDFDRSARALTALGFQFQGGRIHSHHIAMIQVVVKLSRLTWSPDHEDSWVDLAGYAANGYECATIAAKPDANRSGVPAVTVITESEDERGDQDIQDLLRWLRQHGWTEIPARGVGYTGMRSPCGLHQRWIHKSPSSAYYLNQARQWALDKSCSNDDEQGRGAD